MDYSSCVNRERIAGGFSWLLWAAERESENQREGMVAPCGYSLFLLGFCMGFIRGRGSDRRESRERESVCVY